VWFFGREWYSDWMVGPLHQQNGLDGGGYSLAHQMEHRIWSHLSTWVRTPGNAVGRCVLVALVFFWAGSGGTSHQERSWKVVEVILWNFPSWLVNLFTCVWSRWNHIGACWSTFVWFLCNDCSSGLDLVVGSTHQHGCGRWWRSAPVELFLIVGQPSSTCVWSHWNHMVPVGELCVWFLCSVVFFWGWIWW
jgi:hypothetical protein